MRNSPSCFSSVSGTALPLMKPRERPSAPIVRRRMQSSSASRSRSASQCRAAGAAVDVEPSREFGTFCAVTHQPGAAALPEYQSERVDQDRLACAGFAGEDGHAGCKVDVNLIDDRKISHLQVQEHAGALVVTAVAAVTSPEQLGAQDLVVVVSRRGCNSEMRLFAAEISNWSSG